MSEYKFIGNYGGSFNKGKNIIRLGKKLGENFIKYDIENPILMPYTESQEDWVKDSSFYLKKRAGFNSLILLPTISELVKHMDKNNIRRYSINPKLHHVQLDDSKRKFKVPAHLQEHIKSFGKDLAVLGYWDIIEIADEKQVDHYLETFPLTEKDLEELSAKLRTKF